MRKDVRTLFHRLWHYLPFGLFVAAVLCLCFTYGVAVGKWGVFPARILNAGWDSLSRLVGKPTNPHWVHPARYEGEGVVVCKEQQVYPGVTLVTGNWSDGYDPELGLRLLDLHGNVLHEWRCDAGKLWAPYDQAYVTAEETYIHGALLLPDGEVIFNLEYFGLVKLNSRSKVVWKLRYRTHHAIFQDEDGAVWVCGAKLHLDSTPSFPGLKPMFLEDTILKISPDGVVEREISVLDVMYKSGYQGLFRSYSIDILHVNDVEVLSEQKAHAFALFDAGDIMVSAREINTVFVIDGEKERIKWSITYPLGAQHDPDFTEDGYITVYNNHMIQSLLEPERNGSRIIRIDPSTREVTTAYGWTEDQHFFSPWCGKHQHLPNGNMLITETEPGRVFEINPNGKVVWSWIAPRWNKDFTREIQQATRYGEEYASFVNESTKNEQGTIQ